MAAAVRFDSLMQPGPFGVSFKNVVLESSGLMN